MNRNTFVYVIIAILIAIFVGVHLSSAPAEARRTRCPVVNRVNRCDLGGWIYNGNYAGHVVRCSTCGIYYFGCHAGLRRKHAHGRPAPRPQPAPRQTPRQTPQSQAQSPSQTPSQPSQPSQPRQPAQPCRKPSISFQSWTVGQSSGSTTTFITNSKTRCDIEVQVGTGNQPVTTCLITNPQWTVTMSHGFTVTSGPELNATGTLNQVFKYKATFTDSTNDGVTCNQKYPGRSGKPIKVEITFTGTYDGDKTITKTLELEQDEIDGIRQEHVDYEQKVVPSRGHFVSGTPRDGVYNWGHYNYLINKDLADKRLAWAKHCKASWTATNLLLTSGYRHPYHNFVDAGADINNLHGLHQYGLALDAYADVNGDGKYNDQVTMMAAAIKAGAGRRFKYSGKIIVHADWRPTWWRTTAEGGPPERDLDDGRQAVHPSSSSGGASTGGSGDTAPAAPAAPTTTPPPTTPTTVACARGSSCSLGGRASSRYAHYDWCSNRCPYQYWSCDSSAIAWHTRTYTCSACGVSYTRCRQGYKATCTRRRSNGQVYSTGRHYTN